MVVQTRRRKALQEAEEPTKSSPARKMSAREKEDDADVPAKRTPAKATPAKETPAKETPVKGTLMVFDDEDEAEFQTPVGKEDESEYKTPIDTESNSAPKAAKVEDEEEDSDDEAPEAVSTSKAAEDIKKSAQAAQKAVQEQAASLKRKRQQRDELLKKQAEERKKAEEAKPQNDQPEARQTESGARARKRAEKSQIPTVLPAEFLTDSSSEDEDDDAAEVAAGPKRRKVAGVEKRLTRLDAGPKDEVVKSTVYRVAKKTDERLAPKLKKHTKSSKELLLKRNRPASAKSGTGFFKRK
ncbi:hypothetical protein GGI42DRAFT_317291 [Trichoderma sp. SZMC 28013]